MKLTVKDVGVVVASAFVTATLAVALFTWLPGAIAVDEAAATRPALNSDGVVLTLELGRPTYQAGEKPVLTLKAVNTLDRPAELVAQVRMSWSAPSSPYSRKVLPAVESWSTSCQVALKPGETRTFELPVGAALAAGKEVSFVVSAGGKSVVAAKLSIPAAAASEPQARANG